MQNTENNNKKMVVRGLVDIVPDRVDAQGNIITSEAIEKLDLKKEKGVRMSRHYFPISGKTRTTVAMDLRDYVNKYVQWVLVLPYWILFLLFYLIPRTIWRKFTE